MIEDKMVMVPKGVILNRQLNDKRVIAYASTVVSNWSGTDYAALARYSLYSGFRGKDGVISQYKELMRNFFDAGYFALADGGMIYIDHKEQCGIIYYSEFQRILQERVRSKAEGRTMNHAHVLLLLSYIRLYMNTHSGNLVYCSNLLIRISESTGLSVRSISSALRVLEELDIIHNEELPRYKDHEGCWHSNVRVFVNKKRFGSVSYDWQREAQMSIMRIRANQVD